jgi:small subunit ribosomal protein S4
MARYRGPVCRLERRLGKKLHLKGERAFNGKSSSEKRNFPPGQHGQLRTKLSTYGVQLREKQAAKIIYGVLERQFRRYFAQAASLKGVTGTILLQLLESRLDNMVYRAGLATTRAQARQLVRHNHITVNGKRVNIPSFRCRPGDEIAPAASSRNLKVIEAAVSLADRMNSRKSFISWDAQTLTAKYIALPSREDLDDIDVREQLIIELYSK